MPLPKKRSSGPSFARNSISLGHHGKEWRRVRPETVRAGDVVAGVGLIEGIEEVSLLGTFHWRVKTPEGESYLDPDTEVLAFVLPV